MTTPRAIAPPPVTAPSGATTTRRATRRWWIVQSLLLVALVALPSHVVQQDARRLAAIETIRRSLEADGAASPWDGAFRLAPSPFARPTTAWMEATAAWLTPAAGLRLFVVATVLLALGGWWWMATAMRPSRRWFVALLVPLVFHRSHYLGFTDYNLGLAALPWGIGAALRMLRGGTRRRRDGRDMAVLGASALVAALAHQLSVIPFALFVGVLGATRPRRGGRALLVAGVAVAAVVVAVMGPRLGASADDDAAVRAWTPMWPSTMRATLHALDAWDPAAGPLKGVFLLAALCLVLGLRGWRAAGTTEARPAAGAGDLAAGRVGEGSISPFRARWVAGARACGGPVAQRLLLASALLAAAYVLLPSRMGPVSFLSTRLLAMVLVGVAVALPARRAIHARLLGAGIVLVLAATVALHARVIGGLASLDAVARFLPAGTWVKILGPPPPLPPTFPDLSPEFQFDEAAALAPITAVGALTPDLYIPPHTFSVAYRPDAPPLMWRAGTAAAWRDEELRELQGIFPAILVIGVAADDLRERLDPRRHGQIIAGRNWSLWLARPAPSHPTPAPAAPAPASPNTAAPNTAAPAPATR